MIRRIVGLHFSPIGGTASMTRRLTEELASRLGSNSPVDISTETYELLGMSSGNVDLDEETVAVIGMPVYVGKVPLPALYALQRINANGAMAVAAVSFGARSYGNALFELHHYAEEQGFKVIGAGAFSIRYNKEKDSAEGKPYTGDVEALTEFGKAAASKIIRLSGSEIEELRIRPVRLEVAGRLPMHIASRISPRAAAAAQGLLERICIRRQNSEWSL